MYITGYHQISWWFLTIDWRRLFYDVLDFSNAASSPWLQSSWARFLSFDQNKLRLCLANHNVGYFSNLACDWLSIVYAYSEQEKGNGPWCDLVWFLLGMRFQQKRITRYSTLHPPTAIVLFNYHTNDIKYDLPGKQYNKKQRSYSMQLTHVQCHARNQLISSSPAILCPDTSSTTLSKWCLGWANIFNHRAMPWKLDSDRSTPDITGHVRGKKIVYSRS